MFVLKIAPTIQNQNHQAASLPILCGPQSFKLILFFLLSLLFASSYLSWAHIYMYFF
jgi:hypothetical protein